MRKKLTVLMFSVFAVASLAGASTASAATPTLIVKPKYSLVNACRPAAGQLRFQVQFGAKFTRKNSAYPKSVKYSYSVRDQNGVSFASGSVTLTKSNGWKKLSKKLVAVSGTTVYFSIKGSFRSPNSGNLLKNSDSFSFPLATDAELIAKGVPPCI